MTREEQIIEKADKTSEIFYKVNDNYGDCFHGGFIDGAKWADENPQFSKEEFIEKACKWLRRNIDLYAMDTVDARTMKHKIVLMTNFEKVFRKAMEE